MAKVDNSKYDSISDNVIMFFPILRRAFLKVEGENSSLINSQCPILGVLMKRGAMPISEMGEILGISKPNMSVLVDKLISEKKIRRLYDENDRRITRIEISEKGKLFMKKARDALRKDFKGKLSSLNENEIEQLNNSLENIKMIMSKINGAQK